jgi:site-specific recombinase XerD
VENSLFNKTVGSRYRISLEQRQYAPSTIHLRLAAVRRLANETSNCSLLSPDLAARIRTVKGARRLGVRIGNWPTVEEGRCLAGAFGASNPIELGIRAMIGGLIGCGLRRAEGAPLKLEGVQLREGHWVIADLSG